MGMLHKLTVAVAWVLWCTLPALATPEENGDFTMDMWLSPGGSVYMVVYSRLFNPRFLMETVLLRYLSDGRRVETHYLPGSSDSYALSGMLVPAPGRRGFFVVCEEGDRVWVARYLLPAQCVWVRTYKTPDTRREFSWDAGADAAGNLYVITHAEDSLPTFIKLDPHGRMLFSQKVNGYAEHLQVTASGESYVVCSDRILYFAPDGKLRWQNKINSIAPESRCMLTSKGDLVVVDRAPQQDKARLRVFNRNRRLLIHRSVPIPYYHDEKGILYSYDVIQGKKTDHLIVFGYDPSGRRVWEASAYLRFVRPDVYLFVDETPTILKDSTGNVYLIMNFPPLTVIKWDTQGHLQYLKRFRPVPHENGVVEKALVDSQGNLYIGMSVSRDGSDYDSVLVKVSPRGKLEWMRVYDSNLRRVKR